MDEKYCPGCQKNLPLEAFAKGNRGPFKKQVYCRTCMKNKKVRNPEHEKAYEKRYRKAHPEKFALRSSKYRRKHVYKISEEEYAQLLEKQAGRCAVCGDLPTGRRGVLSLDHCHTSGKVRGLLCHRCNAALGFLKDSLDIISRLYWYLKGGRD